MQRFQKTFLNGPGVEITKVSSKVKFKEMDHKIVHQSV